jgi:uncharacterized protein YggL (DUF469 family)
MRARNRMLRDHPMFRKRRQRKWHRTGEFTEYGFDVFGYLRDGLAFPGFIDTLIPFVESRGLGVGGFEDGTGGVDMTVTRLGRGSVTDDDVRAVVRFLEGFKATALLVVTKPYDVKWRAHDARV